MMDNKKRDRCMVACENEIRKFAKKIRNSKILDVGCGTGCHTRYFCRNKNKVTGLDILDLRGKDFPQEAVFKKYSGKRFPFEDNSFDVVVSFDVIEHVKDDHQFVKEIRRVLKKDGKLFIMTPNRNRLSNLLLKWMGKGVKYPLILAEEGELGRLVHEREYSGAELLKLFQKAGFENLKLEYFWFGLRGKVNLGVSRFLGLPISQSLILSNC